MLLGTLPWKGRPVASLGCSSCNLIRVRLQGHRKRGFMNIQVADEFRYRAFQLRLSSKSIDESADTQQG